jgi:hypothetical protein
MKVRVYFSREPESEIFVRNNKISSQALVTLYDLVWESEFKNILNVGKIWLKFKESKKPFGIPLREKRNHIEIAAGDIIQIAEEYYVVDIVGVKKITIAI